eukprot:TRINITY_DN1464_c0_g1_i1.p1 TRINITY_DN1464_c0_g1~~TRINITY_DN1464_c0_g1_i1.p1  ORF type:complete len:246 (-),score=28.87 TRINITY_DN1464_c0_g1_i1:494-1231(-)
MDQLLPTKYITKEGLIALKHYKYNGEDRSILVQLFLRTFWNWLIQFFPTWIAPNLITVIGFSALLTNFFVAVSYCSDCDYEVCGEPPIWVYFMFAFNLWFYQTMDNLDGKQARRTGSSSALGELFDHGCDSLFLILTAAPMFLIWQPAKVDQFLFLTQGVLVFYTSHWEEYFTGHLILGRFANPTEAQCCMIAVFLFTGVVGAQFWHSAIGVFLPFLPTSLAQLTVLSALRNVLWFAIAAAIIEK